MQQQAYPVAYPYMWNVPQWAPTTSMALFMPGLHAAPLQYAGQQRPDVPTAVGSQVRTCTFCNCCILLLWHEGQEWSASQALGSWECVIWTCTCLSALE